MAQDMLLFELGSLVDGQGNSYFSLQLQSSPALWREHLSLLFQSHSDLEPLVVASCFAGHDRGLDLD
ncbi:hypothetical protein [Mameliella sp.]|uniref:hypothetical protein n=1 Tax=Mameliella sp. TaxID=1924940 RepID=UPI003B5131DB